MEQSYVYILTNQDNNVLYTGVTTRLEERIKQHRNHVGSAFTAKYNAHKVVYIEQCPNIVAAIRREKLIKMMPRRRKIALIERINPSWRDLMDE
ncbi:MAG: GIY-YIG nuclease family protein [Alistipes sp.]|nr:GIY-YIG nuclease family protein [Alistipes sp.]MBQ1940193.1 GIY-YIG nuclease family protein [Alistipes sp.]MBQ5393753.1 GIY-YIG nuclease family protein [Alistipes sp.]MBQ5637452.1 GIY-YIG nuclease family protein [Alistipes sp.]MBR0330744.1 GIY-YIG nuclease family protein [Alistipes sp.]